MIRLTNQFLPAAEGRLASSMIFRKTCVRQTETDCLMLRRRM